MFSSAKTDRVKRQIEEAWQAREAGLLGYFIQRFPPEHRVRVLADAAGQEGYFDVETDGLEPSAEITTIALATGACVRVFVEGCDLGCFLEALSGVSLLLSYNGTRFDVPILERRFRLPLPCPHLDLLPVMRAMGWVGGLKACERRLGVERARQGLDAVMLWRRWQEQKDSLALQLLVQYNAQDACSLQHLASNAYRRSMSAYPLKGKLPARS